MIDLHTHILPGLDDGASDMNEAVEMCRMAESDGITTMVATPHTGNGVYVNRRDRILAAVAELNSRLSKEDQCKDPSRSGCPHKSRHDRDDRGWQSTDVK